MMFLWVRYMLLLLLSALLLLFLLLPAEATSRCLTAVVHHAIRFDRHASDSSRPTLSFGSQESLLRGSIVSFNPNDITSYRRQTVFIPTEQHVTDAQWELLVALPVRGIVAATSSFDTHNERLMQRYLSRGPVLFPVYFFSQDDISARQLGDVLSSIGSSEYAVVSIGADAKGVAPVLNTSVKSIHLHASLIFKPNEMKMSSDLPQLLITASFDTLGVAPSAHTTGGASGAAAALELWRRLNVESTLLARNTTAAASASPFTVSMLLGNTARFNYAGTAKWILSRQSEELDNLRLVVCLDELLFTASDNEDVEDVINKERTTLFMHVHDSFAKSPQYANVKKMAESIAALHNISLVALSAKTKYHHYDVDFEHEVLAHRQIPALTFSSVRTHSVDQLFRDIRVSAPINVTKNDAAAVNFFAPLNRRVNFVYAFVRALLGQPAEETERTWVGSAAYMMGLMRHAAQSSRSPVSSDSAGPLKYVEELEAHMKQCARTRAPRRVLSRSVSLSTHRLKSPGVVLIGPYEQVLRVFVAKKFIVEMFILIATLVIVGAFAIFEFGAAKTYRILLDKMETEDTRNKETKAY